MWPISHRPLESASVTWNWRDTADVMGLHSASPYPFVPRRRFITQSVGELLFTNDVVAADFDLYWLINRRYRIRGRRLSIQYRGRIMTFSLIFWLIISLDLSLNETGSPVIPANFCQSLLDTGKVLHSVDQWRLISCFRWTSKSE